MKIEIDYPPDFAVRYGFGKPGWPPIQSMFDQSRPDFNSFLTSVRDFNSQLLRIPFDQPSDSRSPFWKNEWLPMLDGITLYTAVASRKPRNIIEIGSGNSTKFMRRAIDDLALSTRIISIDPQPRAEIDELSDYNIREPLEHVNLSVFGDVNKGDFVFFDGSHRCFQNSDVTVFFMDVIPKLPSSIMIGIHDIFWPHDYPAAWKKRYYNEQYILGAFLLGARAASPNGGAKLVFSCSYAGSDMQAEVNSAVHPELLSGWLEYRNYIGGGCFLFEKP